MRITRTICEKKTTKRLTAAICFAKENHCHYILQIVERSRTDCLLSTGFWSSATATICITDSTSLRVKSHMRCACVVRSDEKGLYSFLLKCFHSLSLSFGRRGEEDEALGDVLIEGCEDRPATATVRPWGKQGDQFGERGDHLGKLLCREVSFACEQAACRSK
jgi:hypothetical protein